MVRRLLRYWFLPILLLAVLLASCRTPTALQPAADRTSPQDADAIAAWVSTLASPKMEGRGIGTAGLTHARDWLVERFLELQLQPAVGGSYLQSLTVSAGVEASRQTLAFTIGSQRIEAAPLVDYVALGFSPNDIFVGPLVFVGYGVDDAARQYHSFGDPPRPLNGKVAVVFRYEPMDEQGRSRWVAEHESWSLAARLTQKVQWAAERGASAVLFVNPPKRGDEGLLSTNSTVAGLTTIPAVHISTNLLSRLLLAAGRDPTVALSTYQQRADAGTLGPDELGVSVVGEVELTRQQATVENVVGVLPGTGALASQWVVIGAHYDHLGYGDVGSLAERGLHAVHPGADDNASGVAALLQTAKLLREWTQLSAASATDRRSVLLVGFTAEERGLLGSTHLLAHLDELQLKKDQITAMLNFDMVGRLRDDQLLITDAATGRGLEQLLRDANRASGAGLQVRFEPLGFGGSDHQSFHQHRIPAAHFFTGGHGDYHRPSDTADKVNAAGIARIARVAATAALELMTRSTPLRFDPEGLPRPWLVRSRVYLGVLPDHAALDRTDGCPVGAVAPASPAQAAGLRSGDVLVSWNGQRVGSFHELTRLLGAAQPDQTVRLRVRRGKETIDLTVTLRAR